VAALLRDQHHLLRVIKHFLQGRLFVAFRKHISTLIIPTNCYVSNKRQSVAELQIDAYSKNQRFFFESSTTTLMASAGEHSL